MRRLTAILCTEVIAAGCETEPAHGGGPAAPLVSPGGAVDWSVYHTAAETHQIVREFAAMYPDLVELEKIGESIHGQELLVAKITNSATGPHHEKPGGIDMNRNWPRNWERWHLQGGSGDFPFSEPETHAVAHFLNRHRNVSLILHGHTSGGFIFRLPSAMDPTEFDRHDEALVIHLADFYTEDTGRPVRPSAVHPVDRRYGTLIQWAYSDFGAIGYVPEFSPPPEAWVPDHDGKGYVDESDWHRFNDEEFDGRYFYDWEPYDHPQLGPV